MNIDNKLREELLFFSVNGKKNVNAFVVYTFLLMKAKHKKAEFRDKRSDKVLCVERGQAMTSINTIAEKTGLTEKQVRTAVDKLIAEKLITKAATKHYTIFTLLHYDTHTERRAEAKKPETQESGFTEADRLYFEELERKIRREPLTKEEEAFFNKYLGF